MIDALSSALTRFGTHAGGIIGPETLPKQKRKVLIFLQNILTWEIHEMC